MVFLEEGVCACHYLAVHEHIAPFLRPGVLLAGLAKTGIVNRVVEVRRLLGFRPGCFMGYDALGDVAVVCCWVWGASAGAYSWSFQLTLEGSAEGCQVPAGFWLFEVEEVVLAFDVLVAVFFCDDVVERMEELPYFVVMDGGHVKFGKTGNGCPSAYFQS